MAGMNLPAYLGNEKKNEDTKAIEVKEE